MNKFEFDKGARKKKTRQSTNLPTQQTQMSTAHLFPISRETAAQAVCTVVNVLRVKEQRYEQMIRCVVN